MPSDTTMFGLEGVDWPNLITELWFKNYIVESAPTFEAAMLTGSPQYKFSKRTDFRAFSRGELELVLKEKLEFVVEDYNEMLASVANNPLPSDCLMHFGEAGFFELVIHQIDVSFIVVLIDELLTRSNS